MPLCVGVQNKLDWFRLKVKRQFITVFGDIWLTEISLGLISVNQISP